MGKHSVAEAEGQLSTLIDSALTGEEVTITRDGVAVVTLQPVPHAARQTERVPRTPEEQQAMIDWLERHRVRPHIPLTEGGGDLVSRMRDEDDARFDRQR